MSDGNNEENEVLPGANTPKHNDNLIEKMRRNQSECFTRDERGWEFTAVMLHSKFGPREYTTWFVYEMADNYETIQVAGLSSLYASLLSTGISTLDITIESVLISRIDYNPIDSDVHSL